jgi:nucleoside-diphosphate-sugar epimerase
LTGPQPAGDKGAGTDVAEQFEAFRGKRVVVTGGLGFIGSNLARRLVELGAETLLIDSLVPEYGGNLFNVADIQDRLTVNISDVRDEYSLRYLVSGCDYLFNLAGQTSHLDSMQNPFADLEINCRAQLSILEVCRRHNPAVRIVFASTRQIYGRPDYLPVDEQHPVRPVDVNGINKMAGEWYHILYNNVYGLRAAALRLTNTIGPRMRVKDARQTFVGVWVRNVIEGGEIEVWGGDQLRDFNYVDDVVDAPPSPRRPTMRAAGVQPAGESPRSPIWRRCSPRSAVRAARRKRLSRRSAAHRHGRHYADASLTCGPFWKPPAPPREARTARWRSAAPIAISEVDSRCA